MGWSLTCTPWVPASYEHIQAGATFDPKQVCWTPDEAAYQFSASPWGFGLNQDGVTPINKETSKTLPSLPCSFPWRHRHQGPSAGINQPPSRVFAGSCEMAFRDKRWPRVGSWVRNLVKYLWEGSRRICFLVYIVQCQSSLRPQACVSVKLETKPASKGSWYCSPSSCSPHFCISHAEMLPYSDIQKFLLPFLVQFS